MRIGCRVALARYRLRAVPAPLSLTRSSMCESKLPVDGDESAVFFRPLRVRPDELRLSVTLPTGQSFRWRRHGDDTFVGVVGRRVFALRSTGDDTLFACLSEPTDDAAAEAALREYLMLSHELQPLHTAWAVSDARFAALLPFVRGARILRQDPLECLLSFVCSSNNNVARIGGMVERLCVAYGEPLPLRQAAVAYLSSSGELPPFFAFPTAAQLGRASEGELRSLGYGYRAPFVVKTVAALSSRPGGGDAWLASLRSPEVPTHAAMASLAEFPGVGPKVAACAALFSLDKHDCVPVDVHVLRLACAHYPGCAHLAGKPPSKAALATVSSVLGEAFGPFAGWAHTALFVAELKGVRDALPEALRTPRVPKAPKKAANKGGDESGVAPGKRKGEGEAGAAEEQHTPAEAKARKTAARRLSHSTKT